MEVENLKPFTTCGKRSVEVWKKVVVVVNKKFGAEINYIAAQRRFDLLIKEFRKEDFANRYKSGKEEDITIIKNKLADLSVLLKDNKEEQESAKEVKNKKLDEEKEAAEVIRGAAVSTIKRPKVDGEQKSPPQKKMNDSTLLQLWKEKQAADREIVKEKMEKETQQRQEDMELKRQELNLREQELDLKKKQFELEKEERKAQLESQKLMLQMLEKNVMKHRCQL